VSVKTYCLQCGAQHEYRLMQKPKMYCSVRCTVYAHRAMARERRPESKNNRVKGQRRRWARERAEQAARLKAWRAEQRRLMDGL